MTNFNAKMFVLNRIEDESGVSGTGVVAVGFIFPNGQCVLSWLTDKTSIAIYPDIETVKAIHGHNGKTQVIQMLDYDRKNVSGLLMNHAADEVELGAMDKNTKYLWDEKVRFAAMLTPITL